MVAGAGGATAAGGAVNITAGAGGSTSGAGGDIVLTPGTPTSGAVGVARTRAGTGAAYARIGGAINSQFSDVGNVGTGEDNLHTYTVPASTLAVDGQAIRYRAVFTVKNTGGALKQVKIKFGATTVYDTGTFLPGADGEFVVDVWIVRTAAATQRALGWGDSGQGASAPKQVIYTTPAETLSGTVVLKATGESSGGGEANNDIVQRLSLVEFVG